MGQIRILQASAGSGKTYTLAYQYIKNVIAEPYSYKEILAVTFTNKATEEMKQRIIGELHTLSVGESSSYLEPLKKELNLSAATILSNAKRAQSLMLHDYSRFAVLTIDKFFQRVIRAFIKELGMDLNFNIELKTQGILENATDNLIEKIASDESLRAWIVAYIDEKIEQGNKWNIKEQLMSLGEEIFKDNFKATTLSREQISELVSTLSKQVNKAQATMREKAQEIIDLANSVALTVDDFANKSRGTFGYVIKLSQGTIEAPTATCLKVANGQSNWYSGKKPKAEILAIESEITSLLSEICKCYEDNLKNFNTYKLINQKYRNFALLNDLCAEIEQVYAQGNMLHITETNHMLGELIAGNDTPFIFEKVGNIFSTFMIDEFQDTSESQWQNFIPLLRNALSSTPQDKETVLLVGDKKQSIYRWRGGDWRILSQKAQSEFTDAITDNLKVNYRSLTNVVDFNNAMIDSIIKIDNEFLNNTLNPELSPSYKNMLSNAYERHYQEPKSTKKEGYVDISSYQKDDNSLIIKKIETLQDQGFNPGDIAILVQKNSEAKGLASMLLEYKGANRNSKYCYDVVTAEALEIGRSADVNFIISVLKLSTQRDNLINLAVVNRYLKREFDSPLDEQTTQMLDSLKTLSPLEAFESIVHYFSLGENEHELAYIQALHNQIISYCNSHIADSVQLVEWWETSGAKESINIPQCLSAITIITVHKSKGLQFKCVIIPYCDWSLLPLTGKSTLWVEAKDHDVQRLGRVPISWVKDIENSHFEHEYITERLLSHIDRINGYYVASTRAEQELHLMIPEGKGTERISNLIKDSLANPSFIEKLGGKTTELGYSFGSPVIRQRQEIALSNSFEFYPTRDLSARENLRTQSLSSLEPEQEKTSFSPRNYGILMHRLFENAHTLEDVLLQGKKLLQDAIIDTSELEILTQMVTKAMNNPTIAQFFSPEWEQVKNESEIILPGADKIKRPDRVMIKGNKAVVMDYKFGLLKSNSHNKQVRQYAELLSEMGYTQVEGYLWYVSLDEIEKCVG